MPVVLDRLPLPNLTWYTGLSVLLLACSVYYAGVQVALNPHWKERLLERSHGRDEEVSLYHVSEGEGRHMTPYLIPEVISFMFHEPLCIWVSTRSGVMACSKENIKKRLAHLDNYIDKTM